MRKIINHHIEGGTRQASSWIANLGHSEGIPSSLPQCGVRLYYSSTKLNIAECDVKPQPTKSSTKFVFWGLIGKTKWPPWPLIGWDIYDFSSETSEQNSTKLDMKQDLSVLYLVCVFRADRKNKKGAFASDWLINFRLLLWNRCMEFNKTFQERKISASST